MCVFLFRDGILRPIGIQEESLHLCVGRRRIATFRRIWPSSIEEAAELDDVFAATRILYLRDRAIVYARAATKLTHKNHPEMSLCGSACEPGPVTQLPCKPSRHPIQGACFCWMVRHRGSWMPILRTSCKNTRRPSVPGIQNRWPFSSTLDCFT